MSIGNELLMIFILILVNAVLAMSEAALVASRKARLQQQAGEGNKSSALAIKLIEDPNIFLSTIQIGITLIGVLAGAVGGATIAESLAVVLHNIPYISEYSTSIALGIVVLSITILTIWLGELVPKRLGLTARESTGGGRPNAFSIGSLFSLHKTYERGNELRPTSHGC